MRSNASPNRLATARARTVDGLRIRIPRGPPKAPGPSKTNAHCSLLLFRCSSAPATESISRAGGRRRTASRRSTQHCLYAAASTALHLNVQDYFRCLAHVAFPIRDLEPVDAFLKVFGELLQTDFACCRDDSVDLTRRN